MFDLDDVIKFILIITCHQRDTIISFAQMYPALLLKYPLEWKQYDKNGELVMQLLDANCENSRDCVLLCTQLRHQVEALRVRIKQQIKRELCANNDTRIKITYACCEYLFGCALNSEVAHDLANYVVDIEPSPLVARYYKNIQTDTGFERPLMLNEAAILITNETTPTQRDIDIINTLRACGIIIIYDIVKIS